MKFLRTLICSLYTASALYYIWLLVIIGKKLWPQFEMSRQTGFTTSGFFLMFVQLFLCWVHFGVLKGVYRNRSWGLMASLLMSGTHSLCALALPGLDLYTTYFLMASLSVFVVTLAQFFSQLAELRA